MSAASESEPILSTGNRIYLYRLLRDALDTGKQTFLPRVEEALEADGISAEALGFSGTRALLEALGDAVTLTVFKGGRVYATVVAQPIWDEALAKAAAAPDRQAKGAGKSWKRKKGDKALKAVRPRAIPQVAGPVVEPASSGDEPREAVAATDAQPIADHHDAPAAVQETAPTPEPAASHAEADPAPAPAAPPEPAAGATEQPDASTADTTPPEPAIEQSAVHSEPIATPEPAAGEPAARPAAPAPRPLPELPADLPRDFSTDVFCPGPHLSELAALLPFGADALGIMTEYFYIALERGTLQISRSRATFPLRYTHDGVRHELIITIKRQPRGTGAPWVVESIDA